MRSFLETVSAEIQRHLDLRCSYCGASMLFGRHKPRAPFLAASVVLSLQHVRRFVTPADRLPAEWMDAFLATCTVMLGYLLISSCFGIHDVDQPSFRAQLRDNTEGSLTKLAATGGS